MKQRDVWQGLLILLYFTGIFFFTANTLPNFDTWFHLKSGEIFLQQGILHQDVFSQGAPNRLWYPHEWLFQIIIYLYTQAFGIPAIQYFIGFFATTQVLILFLFIRKVLKLGLLSSFFIGALYALFCYNFFTARPEIVGVTLLFSTLFILLTYLLTNKNLLWLTIPVIYFWTNVHSSTILIIGFFWLYTVLAAGMSWYTKDKHLQKQSIMLGIYAAIASVISFLPPNGITQYKYLWLYMTQHDNFLFVTEWRPLITFTLDFIIYVSLITTIIIPICIYAWRRKEKTIIWFLPLLALVLMGFSALRQSFFGYFVMVLFLAFFLSKMKWKKLKTLNQTVLVLGCLALLGLSGWIMSERVKQAKVNYIPEAEANFIKQTNLKGKFFNTYTDGGYLLYSLYPERKVFIDGRTDVYYCCEIPEYFGLEAQANLPMKQFSPLVTTFFNKHQFSYAILPINDIYARKIGETLHANKWKMVYWNDHEVIFVKDDGLNKDVIDRFGSNAATPFAKTPYKEKQMDKALQEYLRMNSVTSAAVTKNYIGFIYMQKQDPQKAKPYFEEAIKIQPYFDSAYANLAEVYVQEGNTAEAIKLYETLMRFSSKPAYYYRFAQLYAAQGDKENTLRILRIGLDKAKTPEDKTIFQSSIDKLQ